MNWGLNEDVLKRMPYADVCVGSALPGSPKRIYPGEPTSPLQSMSARLCGWEVGDSARQEFS